MNKIVKTDLGNKEIFARNLKRYLENSRKKQNEVAKAVGVSTGTFNDWMKCRTYPRMDKLQLLAEYFGINKAELVEDVYVPKESISEKDQAVLDIFHQVPLNKRDAAISMLESVVDTLLKL